MGAIVKALVFLTDTLFSIYIVVVILRFLLFWAYVPFRDPVSRFIVQMTQPPLRVLYRFIPAWRNIDVAAIVLMLGLEVTKMLIMLTLYGSNIHFLPLILFCAINLLATLFYVYSFSIFIQSILSFVNPDPYNPIVYILQRLNEPLLKPARRLIPSFEGLDFSPLVVILVLQLGIILIVEPLQSLVL